MLKLVKYLKPYIHLILLSVAFIVVQAMSDIRLPDIMSDIVNIGIQNYGIESPLPLALNEQDKGVYRLLILSQNDGENGGIVAFDSAYKPMSIEEAKVHIKFTSEAVSSDIVYVRRDTIDNSFPLASAEQALVAAMQGIVEIHMPTLADADAELMTNILIRMSVDGMSMEGIEVSGMRALGVDVRSIQNNYIWSRGAVMLGVALLFAVCLTSAVFLSAVIAARFAKDMRQKIFVKVQSFSNTEMDKFTTASLITRSTNDINQIQQLLMSVR
jgi:ATP-binding cassette subfamily B protein